MVRGIEGAATPEWTMQESQRRVTLPESVFFEILSYIQRDFLVEVTAVSKQWRWGVIGMLQMQMSVVAQPAKIECGAASLVEYDKAVQRGSSLRELRHGLYSDIQELDQKSAFQLHQILQSRRLHFTMLPLFMRLQIEMDIAEALKTPSPFARRKLSTPIAALVTMGQMERAVQLLKEHPIWVLGPTCLSLIEKGAYRQVLDLVKQCRGDSALDNERKDVAIALAKKGQKEALEVASLIEMTIRQVRSEIEVREILRQLPSGV